MNTIAQTTRFSQHIVKTYSDPQEYPAVIRSNGIRDEKINCKKF